MEPGQALKSVRRVILMIVAALVLYGVARFDPVLLPEGAVSPLYGIHAGDRLLIDRHARTPQPGETWLYHSEADKLLLGRVEVPPAGLAPALRAELEDGAAWIIHEREIPGITDSRSTGPVAHEALAGRVIFVLPW